MKRFIPVVVAVLVVTAGFGRFDKRKKVEVKVSVDKKQVKVGEEFKYQIEVKGRFRMTPEVIFPNLENFRVISQQRVFNIQMGKKGIISDSKNIFVLIPLQEGEFEIKGIKLRFGFREYNVPAVKITVKGVKQIPHPSAPEEKPQRIPSGGGVWI